MNYDDYTQPIELISGCTIGEHTRHIIEIFQKMKLENNAVVLDYDQRERNILIQTNIDYSIECLSEIVSKVENEYKSAAHSFRNELKRDAQSNVKINPSFNLYSFKAPINLFNSIKTMFPSNLPLFSVK